MPIPTQRETSEQVLKELEEMLKRSPFTQPVPSADTVATPVNEVYDPRADALANTPFRRWDIKP